ncbi:MAG TPA: ATP-binding protein, partial [Balneolaceae bacterium]|nr:ATP-binding protein [Balneolaceae bacterium]
TSRKRYTVGAGFLATLLIVVGFIASETTEYIFMSMTNRMMSITVIWISVWFVNNYKASLEQIKKNEKRMSALFEAATEGIIISDVDGKIVIVNKKTEELFGYSRQELVGKGIETLVPRRYESRHKKYRQQYYKNPEPRPMGQGRDLYGLTKSEEEFPVEVSLNYFETDEGKFIISNVIDISQRKEAEDQLLKAHRELKQKAIELKQSNEELEQFAYVASHDLQEPLRMVASYTQLLARRYKDKLDADANDFIAYAVDGAHRMQQLLNDLLQFSRVGTRAKPFKLVDLKKVVEDALQNIEKLIDENDAEILIGSEFPSLSVDKTQLTQLFQNLVHNAIKFRGKARPEVRINAEELETHWQFSVADNGVGIPQKYQERIFVIFQRLHNRDKYEGSGIGLAICKKIVERHNGKIWMESTLGKGTTFYFTISKELESKENNVEELFSKQELTDT